MTLQLTIHHIFYLKFNTLRSMLHVHKNPTSNQESKMILRSCLFSGKQFSGNHFPNFLVFVCHQKSWSMENTFQSKKNLVWFPGKCFPFQLCLFSGSGFRETTFQTFMCLFAIRKVGQRKTLSGSCEKFRNVIIC